MKITLSLILIFLSLQLNAQEKELTINEVKIQLDAIKTAEIKSACGCSDGMAKIADILVKTTGKYSSKSEIESDLSGKTIMELANKKITEVANQCSKLGINDADIKSCPSFKLLEEKSIILNRKFRR